MTPRPFMSPRYLSDDCTKEIVLRALRERGEETAKQEEDPTVLETQAAQGRGPDCSGMHNQHLGFWGSTEAPLSSCPDLGLCRDSSARRAQKMQATRNPRSP